MWNAPRAPICSSVLDRYKTGVEVLQVRLLDVHPSLEVVSAFRDVAGASEEKSRVMNEAEGYRNERVALARGNAEALLQSAQAHSLGRKNRSQGDASRFIQTEQAFRAAPGPNQTRLYLETLEQVLPGKRKIIIDSSQGRRHLLLARRWCSPAAVGSCIRTGALATCINTIAIIRTITIIITS